MAYDETGVIAKLTSKMDEFFYLADGIYRLNVNKLGTIVSDMVDVEYEKGFEHGYETAVAEVEYRAN